ncbi:hypothetical protein EJB05_13550, partial [Eragrostis curvula]
MPTGPHVSDSRLTALARRRAPRGRRRTARRRGALARSPLRPFLLSPSPVETPQNPLLLSTLPSFPAPNPSSPLPPSNSSSPHRRRASTGPTTTSRGTPCTPGASIEVIFVSTCCESTDLSSVTESGHGIARRFVVVFFTSGEWIVDCSHPEVPVSVAHTPVLTIFLLPQSSRRILTFSPPSSRRAPPTGELRHPGFLLVEVLAVEVRGSTLKLVRAPTQPRATPRRRNNAATATPSASGVANRGVRLGRGPCGKAFLGRCSTFIPDSTGGGGQWDGQLPFGWTAHWETEE